MAKIDQVEQLPHWFSLKKYEDCASFKAIDWVTNLQARALILELISDGDLSSAIAIAEPLREEPIDCFRGFSPLPESPVKPMSFNDMIFEAWIDRIPLSSKGDLWTTTLDSIAAGAVIGDASLNVPIGHDTNSSRPLYVNLKATDAVLIEAFGKWLKSVRPQSTPDSKRQKPPYQRWASYGLLPYLDLLIWSRETGNQIPMRLMASAVGYVKGGNSFEKTVPALADKLLKDIGELEALATLEGDSE